MLPGRSGIDVLREMRADPQLRDVPVLMLSAWQSSEDVDGAMDAGADSFLGKPFRVEELVERRARAARSARGEAAVARRARHGARGGGRTRRRCDVRRGAARDPLAAQRREPGDEVGGHDGGDAARREPRRSMSARRCAATRSRATRVSSTSTTGSRPAADGARELDAARGRRPGAGAARGRARGEQIDGYLTDYAEPVIEMAQVQPGAATERGGRAARTCGARRRSGRRSARSRRLEDRRSAARSAHVHAGDARGDHRRCRRARALGRARAPLRRLGGARRCAPGARDDEGRVAGRCRRLRRAARRARPRERWRRSSAAFNSMARSLDSGRREVLAQNQQLRESEQHKRDLISMVSHELRTPLASRARLHDAAARARLRAGRAASLPRDRRHAGAAAGGARRRLPRRAAARRRRDEARPRARRPDRARRASRRGSSSRISTRTSSSLELPGRGRRDRRRPRPARAGDREPALERDQVLARGRRRRACHVELEGDARGARWSTTRGWGSTRQTASASSRSSSAAPRRRRGSRAPGLGLAVAREIVETHGGEIRVQSRARRRLDVLDRAAAEAHRGNRRALASV